MPNLIDEIIAAPVVQPITVRLEPAFNTIQALLMISKAEQDSNVDEWFLQTYHEMTPEERHKNKLVAIGFYYAIAPDRNWPSFPAYLQHLRETDPAALRDKMLDAYDAHPYIDEGQEKKVSVYDSLGSLEDYLDFLRLKFNMLDVKIESEAYQHVLHPETMRQAILDHLASMWEKYLAPEWQKVKPTLKAVVNAFEGVDFRETDRMKAAEWIVGRDVTREWWSKKLQGASKVIFVPSMHAGPYCGLYVANDDTMRVVYQARLPKNLEMGDTTLSRAEILIRLNTLADDARLRIMQYILENGETRSQALIDDLNLSQSAASRHLSALSGMGYLTERRCDGAKCYSLNRDRIEETIRALSGFLLG